MTDDSSAASSDFFSPISISFFQPRQDVSTRTTSTAHSVKTLRRDNVHRPPNASSTNHTGAERLPPAHDSSWIGARLSPIASLDSTDDEGSNDGSQHNHYSNTSNTSNSPSEQDSVAAEIFRNRAQHYRHRTIHNKGGTGTGALAVQRPNERTRLLPMQATTKTNGGDDTAATTTTTTAPFRDSKDSAVVHATCRSLTPRWTTTWSTQLRNRPAVVAQTLHPVWDDEFSHTTAGGGGGGRSSSGRDRWCGGGWLSTTGWCGGGRCCCRRSRDDGKRRPCRTATSVERLGTCVVGATGLHLLSMGLYDGYYGYWEPTHPRDENTNKDDTTTAKHTDWQSHAWAWPWGIPPSKTLLRFGALPALDGSTTTTASSTTTSTTTTTASVSTSTSTATARIKARVAAAHLSSYGPYFTPVTSLVVCTSLAQWLLLVIVWKVWRHGVAALSMTSTTTTTRSTPTNDAATSDFVWYGAVYLVTGVVGQWYRTALDGGGTLAEGGLTSSVLWGTCGVLCATAATGNAVLVPIHSLSSPLASPQQPLLPSSPHPNQYHRSTQQQRTVGPHHLFVLAAGLVLVELLQRMRYARGSVAFENDTGDDTTTARKLVWIDGSLWAVTASAFLGWALGAATAPFPPADSPRNRHRRQPKHKLYTFLATGWVVWIVSIPVLVLALQSVYYP